MKAVVVSASVVALLAVTAYATCPPDSVAVGTLCVDKYEASVWQVPVIIPGVERNAGRINTNARLIKKIHNGTVTLEDLTRGGATQISPASMGASACTPGFPETFPANGNWTAPLYAVSIAGVHPTGCVTWFQASQACRLSGRRLLTNAEWQDAAAGTPDGSGGDNGETDCNTATVHDVVNTGSRSNCRSSWGAFDMVGNVDEWVQDWVPRSMGTCPGWGAFSGDSMCLSGAQDVAGGPGALYRGGNFFDAFPPPLAAGPFAVNGVLTPADEGLDIGFRCAR